jgi:protein-disulfide isomerase
MNQGIVLLAVAAVAAAIGAGAVALSKDGSSPVTGATDKASVEKIVREYILSHPEILPLAMKNLEASETVKRLSGNRAAIETPFGSAWEGASDGDVTLVEFFDYACGYCKGAVADIARLLAEDKKLKVVYREMPVLGEPSLNAARLSIVAAKSPNYMAFHKALYGGGRPDDAGIDAALASAGLNPATARAEAKMPFVEAELAKSSQLQTALALNGTPSWVVGDKVIIGAVGYDELKAAIAETRKARVKS